MPLINTLFVDYQSQRKSYEVRIIKDYWIIATKSVPEDKWNETNIALGYLAHLVILLSKYFNVFIDGGSFIIGAFGLLYWL